MLGSAMPLPKKPRKRKEPDRFELARRQQRRAEMEAMADRGRQRPLPTKFATEVAPKLGWTSDAELHAREDQRFADERAGRETKPFEEMDHFEILYAMPSYDGPEDYPAELEARIQRIVEEPPPKLSPSAQAALLEVLNLRQRLERCDGDPWIPRRLGELLRHRSPSIKWEAAKLILDVTHPPEEMRPTRSLKPKKVRSRN